MAANKYTQFLDSKRIADTPTGLDTVPPLNPMLIDFQRDITEWALRRGRAAIFADCGLGKTPMQLEWARHVPGRVLIVAPLAVAQQTVGEGEKFGVPVTYAREQGQADKSATGITITNYEMLHKFSPEEWAGIVLDESSILKSFSGVYRQALTKFAKGIPFRLCCTATPAPNDLIELSNHAEFLDVMSGKEILALFFVQDGNTTHKWKLKGHGRQDFWRWLATWSVAVRKPSDLGYEDGRFDLPPLRILEHAVEHDEPGDGFLFAMEANTLAERRDARKATIERRVEELAALINGSKGPWLVWCNLNQESAMATKAVDGAVEVKGADTIEHKTAALTDFARGKIHCLVTKPSIAGWGMNWQNCSI